MSAIPFWDENPELWDLVTIGDVPVLGLASVTIRKGGQIDSLKAPGTDNATLRHLGYEPAQVQISIRMWLQEHFDNYQDLIDFIQTADPSTVPQPIDVYHPTLAVHRIHSLYFMLSEPPKATSVKGVWEAVLIAQEWVPKDKTKKSDLTPTRSTSLDDIKSAMAAPATKQAPAPSQTLGP